MEIFKELAQYGGLGLISAVLLVMIGKLQARMFKVIDNNTKAMVRLQEIISKCHLQYKKGDRTSNPS